MYKYETRHLILRDFREEDFAAVHEYGSDPSVSEYEPWGPNTKEETQSFIQKAIDSAKSKPRIEYELAACLNGSNELIGSGRVDIDKEFPDQVSIGYVVHPNQS